MHDLGYNPDAHAIDERTRYNLMSEPLPSNNAVWPGASATSGVDTVYDVRTVTHLDPAQLRTVSMPDLRSADARTLDARARGLDCRTADDKVVAELVRIVDCLQALTLRVEMLEGVMVELARAAGIQEAQ